MAAPSLLVRYNRNVTFLLANAAVRTPGHSSDVLFVRQCHVSVIRSSTQEIRLLLAKAMAGGSVGLVLDPCAELFKDK